MNITVDPDKFRGDLLHAIENKELYMEYQPKINIIEGKTAGSEALIRWNHPQYGMVSPAIFIPFAVEMNLNEKISEFVMNSVCEQVKKWEKDEVPVRNVSFNLSPKSFLNPKLVDTIQNIFQYHQVSPEIFEIEITEEAILQKIDIVNRQFSQLKEMGFKFALDDLGQGFSSFSLLTEFPFDTVKIDRSYIQEIDKSLENRFIVKSFIEVSKNIGKKVVAEGVESKEQLSILYELKCDEIQGFYYSPSVPGKEMADWYKLDKIAI